MTATSRRQDRIPQPRPLPLIGNVPDIDAAAPVQSLAALAKIHGPLFRVELPSKDMLLVNDVALATEAFDETRFEKIVHNVLQNLRGLAGDGLFTAFNDEPNWGKAHRILMSAFGPGAMRDVFPPMLDIAEQLVTKWQRQGPDEVHDVADEMTRLTLDTIALAGFDYRFNSFYRDHQHPFVDAMVRSLAEAGARGRRLKLQHALMVKQRQQFDDDNAAMHRVCDEVIARRRAQAGTGEAAPRDLLNLMMTAKDPETGETLDDVNIRYQLVTFLIAGHETTSGLLSFAIHLLLEHPEILRRARGVVDDVLGDETPRYEHIARLGYLDQILRETLRLFPTAPAIGVTPRHDTTLGGHVVKKGQVILVLPPTVHKDPAVWTDPERFDPERFEPERRAQIPAKAWIPFGNGERSCIGRAFAMQEATLVLAMLLQRFDLARPAPYTLHIKETLTLKPEGLMLQVKARAPASRPSPSSSSSSSSSSSATEPSSSSSSSSSSTNTMGRGEPVLVLYGSNAGTAEGIARRLASEAMNRGYDAAVAPLDAHAGGLPERGAVVVVTASYNGRPPDNARAFVDASASWRPGACAGLRYAVLGCGSRDWPKTFQAIPRLLDERLADGGATRLLPAGEADATADFFGAVEQFSAALWPALAAAFGPSPSITSSSAASSSAASSSSPTLVEAAGPLYTMARVATPGQELIAAHGLRFATVRENRELVDMGAPFARSKRHVVLELPDGVDYAAGDAVAVLPENHPELVQRALRHFNCLAQRQAVEYSKPFGREAPEFNCLAQRQAVEYSKPFGREAPEFHLTDDTAVVLQTTRPALTTTLPTGRPVSILEILRRHVELSTPATRQDLLVMAAHNPCPPHRDHLRALASDDVRYVEEVLKPRLSVLEWLERYRSTDLPLPVFLELLPPTRVRRYSVASSPLVSPRAVALTVAVVDAPAWSGQGRFHGMASTYMARLQPGDRVAVAVKQTTTPFFPPKDNTAPMLLIAAGTGFAPFRGFLQERFARADAGEPAGPTTLFMGCDRVDVDLLYADELRALEGAGRLTLRVAEFQKPEGEGDDRILFVQHRLWQHRDEVKRAIDDGAFVFLCGDGRHMAPAVKQTLHRILGDGDEARGEAALAALEAGGRFVADLFA